VRQGFNKGISRDLKWRVRQLQQLEKMMNENIATFKDALEKDLGMNLFLSESEVLGYHEHIRSAISKMEEWNAPKSCNLPAEVFPSQGELVPEPLGVVLIISPWNYPLSLITRPLIGAIAAGNAVIIKPSEVSENMAKAVISIYPKYMDNNAIAIVSGGPEETKVLLKEKFDKICYTGNTAVGKIVMKAASEHLTPVLLELGGKSPLIVDNTVNLRKALPRIIWGKFLNAGQTCIAPDYALVHKDVYPEFLTESIRTIENFWGKDQQANKDFGRIINHRHVNRIKQLLKGCHIHYGGKIDEDDRYIGPTIITEPDPTSPLMSEEIFGPLFPVFQINNVDEAISFVNDRPKPLALYIFTENSSTAKKVISNTSSGGACVNETVLHNICTEMPFGGVGDSGMGGYNGKYTFDEFVHYKPVLSRGFRLADPSLRFPPYTPEKLASLGRLKKIGAFIPLIKKLLTSSVLLVAVVIAIKYFT
jgi:acyl-CoA reductase-like NAD-dependent aldehyde dehydrogenase